MKRTCYLPLIAMLVIPAAFSQSLGGVAGSTEQHVKGTFKCTRTSQGGSSTTSSSDAADEDTTHVTTLAQHDTTKSTERPDYTTKERVKNQSMYWISNYTTTWSAAVDRCHQLYDNGHLVHIDNEEENNEVKAIRLQANIGHEYIWIGIHDSENEGEWKYEDGNPLTYKNWNKGEPDGYNDQYCGVMNKNGLYHDRKCTTRYYFCCEYYL
ncbi:C-type lectin 1-like isoform X2 [Apostichopus japonicus]|uniref:C-type lectin 1-like isoform X2 n=1 Tax=Stichopus japonicus TaxID=307972 RepID=UPI003AB8FD94